MSSYVLLLSSFVAEERMALVSRPMSDFVGLEDVNPSIAQALINFSFFVASGDMDRFFSLNPLLI